MNLSRAQLLETEVARLEQELALLDRQWTKRPWLLLFALAAIPAYFVFGGEVAAVVLLATPALVAVQSYLLHFRREECRELIAETRRQLAGSREKRSATLGAALLQR
jgi:hypothetical protein